MAYLLIRLNKELKIRFQQFCRQKGVTITDAILLYINAFVQREEMPFKIVRDICFVDELTTIGLRINSNLHEKFINLCTKYDLSKSFFIRDFVIECVANGDFPYDINKGDINRVRDVRIKRSLTQASLAEMIGVSRVTLIAIEQGKRPTEQVASTLCSVLGKEYSELFNS